MRLWCALITCAAALATRFAVSGTARHGGGGLKLPPVWSPHRLTATALQTYVDKTFGPYQRCLTVASEDTAEAIAIVATLHRRESSLTGEYLRWPPAVVLNLNRPHLNHCSGRNTSATTEARCRRFKFWKGGVWRGYIVMKIWKIQQKSLFFSPTSHYTT